MQSYSASHERDEARYMNSGIRRALLSIILCPIPVISQLLAISAYMREATRLTAKHKARLAFGTIIAVLALLVTIAALFGEIYVYTQRSDLVDMVKEKAQTIFLSESQEEEEGGYYDMGYTDEMDGDVPDAYSTNDEDWIVNEDGEWIYVGDDLEEVEEIYDDDYEFDDEYEYDEEYEDEYDAEFDFDEEYDY